MPLVRGREVITQRTDVAQVETVNMMRACGATAFGICFGCCGNYTVSNIVEVL